MSSRPGRHSGNRRLPPAGCVGWRKKSCESLRAGFGIGAEDAEAQRSRRIQIAGFTIYFPLRPPRLCALCVTSRASMSEPLFFLCRGGGGCRGRRCRQRLALLFAGNPPFGLGLEARSVLGLFLFFATP